MDNMIPLNMVAIGEKCRVKKINLKTLIRRRIHDLGLIHGTVVQPLHKSPLGDPVAYLIRGAVIAIRSETASLILVEKI